MAQVHTAQCTLIVGMTEAFLVLSVEAEAETKAKTRAKVVNTNIPDKKGGGTILRPRDFLSFFWRPMAY